MELNTNPVKVAFVGTSCVGKTSAFEHYRRRHSGNPETAFVEEAARLHFTRNPYEQDRFSERAQRRVQDLALNLEQDAHATGAKRIYCDRSVLDAAAYVRATGDIAGSRRLFQKVAFWLPTYTAIFLLTPGDIPYATDEVRKESHETREQFHAGFVELFRDTSLAHHLISGTLGERLQQIDCVVQTYSQKHP